MNEKQNVRLILLCMGCQFVNGWNFYCMCRVAKVVFTSELATPYI